MNTANSKLLSENARMSAKRQLSPCYCYCTDFLILWATQKYLQKPVFDSCYVCYLVIQSCHTDMDVLSTFLTHLLKTLGWKCMHKAHTFDKTLHRFLITRSKELHEMQNSILGKYRASNITLNKPLFFVNFVIGCHGLGESRVTANKYGFIFYLFCRMSKNTTFKYYARHF